jgi:dolichol-phosphate mannosyltransferase
MGLLVVFFSIIGIIYAIFMRFFMPEITVSGWTFLVISILFLGGVQMIMIGILGNYIGRIYSEVQQRPLYIVDEIIGFN